MNLGIVGSRLFRDDERTRKENLPAYKAAVWTRGYIESQILGSNPTRVVSGGAIGIDTMGEQEARKHGYDVTVYRPKPKGEGRTEYIRALFARNTEIAEDSDELLAIMPKGGSSGTMDTVRKAKARGIPVLVVTIDLETQMAHVELFNA